MHTTKAIHTVSAHAAGEVGDVIVGGVAPPPGRTLWEQRTFIAEDGALRDFMLNEPRGGVFRHANLLVPAKNPAASMGVIVMEPADTPPMSGSNAICVSTVLLETGILAMHDGIVPLTLEFPGGLVPVRAECRDGRVLSVEITNLPSFVALRDVPLQVKGLGTLRVDTAFGGDSFVIVTAAAAGFRLDRSEAKELAICGAAITAAANAQLGFSHPSLTDWRHISFCLFTGPVDRDGDRLTTRHAVAIRPGKIDRSPTGTAVSAHMALLASRGAMTVGETLIATSLIGSAFVGRIGRACTVAEQSAIVPTIEGRAHITGFHQHLLAPDDPWPRGYRLSDTWPGAVA